MKTQLDQHLDDIQKSRRLLRNLITVARFDFPEDIIKLIESILKYEQCEIVDWRSITNINLNTNIPTRIGIWKGDITKIKAEVIVNAANSYMCGCFTPGHACIDNAIHDKAGPRLRMECRNIMRKQNELEETGKAKITSGYCLPSDYVLHTVGPIANYEGHEQPELLANCYRECLNLAKEHKIRSIVFCCVSTGVFGYPQRPAAKVAMGTVKEWLLTDSNYENMDGVIFNVFKHSDMVIYEELKGEFFGVGK